MNETGLFVFDRAHLFSLVALILDVAALISIWRRPGRDPKVRIVWTIVVALLPIVGALAWFLLGREKRRL